MAFRDTAVFWTQWISQRTIPKGESNLHMHRLVSFSHQQHKVISFENKKNWTPNPLQSASILTVLYCLIIQNGLFCSFHVLKSSIEDVSLNWGPFKWIVCFVTYTSCHCNRIPTKIMYIFSLQMCRWQAFCANLPGL